MSETPKSNETNTQSDEKRRKKIFAIALIGAILVFGGLVAYIYTAQQKYIPPPPKPTIELKSTKDVSKESWIAQSATELQQIREEQKKLKEELEAAKKAKDAQPPTVKDGTSPSAETPPPLPPLPPPPQSGGVPQYPTQGQQPGQTVQQERILSNLIAFEENKPTTTKEDKKTKEEKKDEMRDDKKDNKNEKKHLTLPAGTFVKVVLMSGVDAPSGMKGKGSPYPALMKIVDLARLPNQWQSDIKGCVILGEAHGELSSERANIRVNNLSCMTKDGEVLETSISGYAVGEDGKIGVAGRVVTKQGAVLARALVAGFLQGVSQAFSQSATIVNVTPSGQMSTIDPSKSLQAGVGIGASKAAEELSKFYIELAKEMFPVVEINAGREIEIILLNKISFK